MEQGSVISAMNTFVVRLWIERSATGSHWLGRIEHVQSGESAAFSDIDGMLSFMGCFVEMHREKEGTE